MTSAYLDTTGYDHIRKRRGITEKQFQTLKDVIAAGHLRVLVGSSNIEEIVTAFPSRPSVAMEALSLLLELSDLKRDGLKPHNELFVEDVRSYSEGRVLPSRALNRNRSRALAASVRRLASAGKPSPELMAALEETRGQREEFRLGMETARTALLKLRAEQLDRFVPAFEQYRDRVSRGFVESLVGRIGVLDACKRRGFDGLLRIPTVAIVGNLSASLAYAQTFEGRVPRPGDSRDMHHALLATSADVFVTDDTELKRHLDRLPLGGLSVVSLTELLGLASKM